MKETIGTITAVIGIGLLLLSGCTNRGSAKSGDSPKGAMFRANLQRTGVYKTRGVHKLSELKWKSKTEDYVHSSLPSPMEWYISGVGTEISMLWT